MRLVRLGRRLKVSRASVPAVGLAKVGGERLEARGSEDGCYAPACFEPFGGQPMNGREKAQKAQESGEAV